MRVTHNTNFEAVRNSIRTARGRMENLQMQAATMRKLNTPSDDPIGASKVLEVRTEKVNNDQFQSNAKMAEMFLINTDHALSEMSELVLRAKEIALSQASGASSTHESRIGVVEEVNQLYNQAVATANRRIGDRFLFGGYKTQTPPVDPSGKFVGDDGQIMVEVGRGVYLAMNVSGLDAFNTNPKDSPDAENLNKTLQQRSLASEHKPEGTDDFTQVEGTENINVFDELQNLRIGLLTGDLDGIRDTLDRFELMHAKLVSVRSKIGSRLQGLESTAQAIERHNLTNAQLTSQLEDADMAQVVSDMAKEETVFRTALQSSNKLIQPTLMDFLR